MNCIVCKKGYDQKKLECAMEPSGELGPICPECRKTDMDRIIEKVPEDKIFYQEDNQVIICGDCLELMKNIPDKSIDLIVTDPPYGFGRFKGDEKDYLKKISPSFQHWPRILKEKGAAFVFTSTGEVLNMGNAIPLNFRRMLWMYKPNDCTYPLEGWLLKSEAILWFSQNGTSNFKERKPYRHDCYINNHSNGKDWVVGHPTVKPLNVIEDFVSRCPKDGVILDPFLGSGTTVVACKELGRKSIGIEINPDYCEIAKRRLRQEVLF